jgi:antibiotic biosynthesis monooxygenase (ABM) superfamily enzyme
MSAGLPESWMLVVNASVDPSVEDEWNTWYDHVHLPEIAECPGFIEAARYVTADNRGQRRYETIYRLESPEAVHTVEFTERRGWYQFDQHVEANVRLFRRTGIADA